MAEAKKTKLTRQEMEDVIKGGGGILIGDEVITTLDGLPDEAQSAEDLDAQIAALQARRDALAGAGAPAPVPQAAGEPTGDVNQAVVDALRAAGFDSAEKVAAASDEDLLKVSGVGQATVAKLRAAQASQGA